MGGDYKAALRVTLEMTRSGSNPQTAKYWTHGFGLPDAFAPDPLLRTGPSGMREDLGCCGHIAPRLGTPNQCEGSGEITSK